ncbi:conserved Plasmodium protein, unknown function [Plasmodium knowlesi strain H]|uniref:ERCC4 domain-containing protein n=3 Tax=Plasmodium knowlesi TaxID=5850 RepID=A0A5K1V343_PLAKH|nr:ERCC4 domain-containing protein, putative [Plasmodium knowlesi strain H]OTN67164.1 Uncharacterized protein PKNOH_S07462100 [Plasmodium knowlesi]CAA9988745.1 ERCC4 domain-containing protein, putative [Plasmodium knowlesi strain H]SBO21695.1 conserved Plasmodium protein, unknown function [Plasmodium knowlesi strain H]SBO22070.1 conserved Plasmodium protein, unknown function [Plasmodium knowlesi strain H]VVS78219.1 ERCC4 domain-containing protein, putative [Plasmodium knowlesi strain H]|eukprot:XP_002259721.1 hypothetical protein, conserved in Plasmodium species [Plasmodium knowlesi strain H]
MENIRIVLSEDLRGGRVHTDLQELLKEEEEKDKNETAYGKMLQGGSFQEGHSQMDGEGRTPILEQHTCHIYTNFPYKSHFVKNHERKNQEDGSNRYMEDMDLSGYNQVEETPGPTELQLALILVLIDERYVENECPFLRTSILNKIEKIQKSYDHVKIICLFIGVREYISRMNFNREVNASFDKGGSVSLDGSIPEGGRLNPYDGEHSRINEKMLDRLITTLLVRYQVDSIEMENEKYLHRFIFKCCQYLYMSKVRKVNSYFKVKPAGLSQLKFSQLNEEICNQENLNQDRLNQSRLSPAPPGTLSERRHFSTWISQLMQINGLSEDASINIAQAFNTPFDLIMHFKKKGDEECLRDFIISSSYGDRRLGKALSRKVFRVFSPDAHPDNYVS